MTFCANLRTRLGDLLDTTDKLLRLAHRAKVADEALEEARAQNAALMAELAAVRLDRDEERAIVNAWRACAERDKGLDRILATGLGKLLRRAGVRLPEVES